MTVQEVLITSQCPLSTVLRDHVMPGTISGTPMCKTYIAAHLFVYLGFLGEGHTWLYLRLTPVSVLRDHSWCTWGTL